MHCASHGTVAPFALLSRMQLNMRLGFVPMGADRQLQQLA